MQSEQKYELYSHSNGIGIAFKFEFKFEFEIEIDFRHMVQLPYREKRVTVRNAKDGANFECLLYQEIERETG